MSRYVVDWLRRESIRSQGDFMYDGRRALKGSLSKIHHHRSGARVLEDDVALKVGPSELGLRNISYLVGGIIAPVTLF